MKNILAENMRRFHTKNLTEATSKNPFGIDGKTVTLWADAMQTEKAADIRIMGTLEGPGTAIITGDSDSYMFKKGNAYVTTISSYGKERLYNKWLINTLTQKIQ